MNPLRFSSLRWMAKSAAHYRYYLDHETKETKPQRLGSALDALLFGHKEVLTFYGASRRGKAWDNFRSENPEAVLLTPQEREQVDGMLTSVQANSRATEYLSGKAQETIQWEMAGRQCQGTPDVYTTKRVVELKTTLNASPDWFMWDARRRGYHAQLVWYHNGLKVLDKTAPDALLSIVAVESSPPFPVTIFDLDSQSYEEGQKVWVSWFERLLVCERNDLWPAYTEAIVPFTTPDVDKLTLKIDGEEVEVE